MIEKSNSNLHRSIIMFTRRNYEQKDSFMHMWLLVWVDADNIFHTLRKKKEERCRVCVCEPACVCVWEREREREREEEDKNKGQWKWKIKRKESWREKKKE